MKNPFYTNFLWLGITILLLLYLLFSTCSCEDYCFSFSPRVEGLLIGILSAAALLFLAELVLFIRDKKRFGFLSGKYKRLKIYQLNKDKKQWDKNEIIEVESGEQFEYKADSVYHRLMIYDSQILTLKINLTYLFGGKYVGKADYNEGSADITISLDTTNEMQGKGTYEYYTRKDGKLPDIGKYEIQIQSNSQHHTTLFVYYKNTIPSGAAEGYEIWEKI